MSELTFSTSKELVEELTTRSTFAGIVIHSDKEIRSDVGELIDKNWDITYSRLTARQVYDILKDAAEHFNELAIEEEINGE